MRLSGVRFGRFIPPPGIEKRARQLQQWNSVHRTSISRRTGDPDRPLHGRLDAYMLSIWAWRTHRCGCDDQHAGIRGSPYADSFDEVPSFLTGDIFISRVSNFIRDCADQSSSTLREAL